jgi:rhamnogalacturonyl hydrolase YesR
MKTSGTQDKVINSIQKLDNWLEKNGWAGFDPYDIKGHPMFLRLQQLQDKASFVDKVKRRLLFSFQGLFPMASRKLFGIKKQVNAKAMGLFASAYINLYHAEKREQYLEKAKQCIDWLLENSSKGYSGLCWGYPFDWQSLVFIPKGTPSGVVSSTCGHAFWGFYQLTREKRYLEICKSICKFYLNDLNIDVIDDNRICFSYTPVDNFHVHNANLFIAESLIRVGAEIDNSEFVEMGMKSLNYTLAEQNSDGSFYYWVPPDKLLYYIDHYHTGFVLRALYSIYKITKDHQLFLKIEKCYRHYLENLFEDNMIPKLKPDSKYPINIHSCAEAILCLSMLSEDFPEGLETLKRTATWTIQNMQDKKGYFYYMVLPKRTIKIPYIRWAQAWMLNALSMYYQIRF